MLDSGHRTICVGMKRARVTADAVVGLSLNSDQEPSDIVVTQ